MERNLIEYANIFLINKNEKYIGLFKYFNISCKNILK